MAMELVALLIDGSLTTANPLASTVAMALGGLATASPHRAAEIWGSQRLRNLTPERRALFVAWYRAFGILLFLGGVFFAIDSILLSKYNH
jgi:Sec-independent protein secretion pathway component TatC